MKLLTAEMTARFAAIGSQDGKYDDAIVVAKFFHPFSAMYWFATEYDPTDETFFGWVYSPPPGCSEKTYWSLDQFRQQRIRGLPMERDLYWREKTLGEVKREIAAMRGEGAEVKP